MFARTCIHNLCVCVYTSVCDYQYSISQSVLHIHGRALIHRNKTCTHINAHLLKLDIVKNFIEKEKAHSQRWCKSQTARQCHPSAESFQWLYLALSRTSTPSVPAVLHLALSCTTTPSVPAVLHLALSCTTTPSVPAVLHLALSRTSTPSVPAVLHLALNRTSTLSPFYQSHKATANNS